MTNQHGTRCSKCHGYIDRGQGVAGVGGGWLHLAACPTVSEPLAPIGTLQEVCMRLARVATPPSVSRQGLEYWGQLARVADLIGDGLGPEDAWRRVLRATA